MDEETLILIAIIVVLFLMTVCSNSPMLDSFKQKAKKKMVDRFAQPETGTEGNGYEDDDQKDAKFDDDDDEKNCNKLYISSSLPKAMNMYGTPSTTSKIINFGAGFDKKSKLSEYEDILMGEIGKNTIDSHKTYCSTLKNDSTMRYLDSEIETNYVNAEGLSLSRRSNPTVAVTNATQEVGLDNSQYRQTGSISDFGALSSK